MLIFFLISYNTTAQVAGDLDTSFNPDDLGFGNGDKANSNVLSTAIQTDGKIIIGGFFTIYNGIIVNRIARLNTDGTLDTTFATGTGANEVVYSTAIQTDGKIIIAGNFTSYNGATANRIARLNTNGTLDTTFNIGTGVNIIVYSIAMQTDGKIIVVGDFTSYNGTTANRIIRLNTNGTLDSTFTIGTGANIVVSSINIQNDGKIIIGGAFTSYNGTTANRIARLNSNGTLDTTFNTGTGLNATVYSTAIQTDGKIIVGGFFTSHNGTTVIRIARLNTGGTLDTTFTTGSGASGDVRSIAIQTDGKIIIGGGFASYNSISVGRIARLNTNGTLDTTFTTGTRANSDVYSTTIQTDGKIIIGGIFTTYNGTTTNYIARLNTNGTLDATFTGTGASGDVRSIAIQADEKIIIGGGFTTYNNTIAHRVARINTDGTLDTTFTTGTGANTIVYSIAIQADGKIIIGGFFTTYNGTTANRIARLNIDGTLDSTFTSGIGANDFVTSTAIQTDGKIIIVGNFTSYNGTTANRIARLNTNGTLDTTFNIGTGLNATVYSTAIQIDGKIIIGGNFTMYNGVIATSIARLNTNGTLDTTFTTGTGANNSVLSTAIQTDGKIIIGGSFTTYNGTIANGIVRLNADGTLDTIFITGSGTSGIVRSTAIQTDLKIIIGGDFTTYNGTVINYIARLNTDGALDTTFASGTGANGSIYSTDIQIDGKIIIGGFFTGYKGIGRNRIARIHNSDVLSTNNFEFLSSLKIYPNPSTGIYNIVIDGNTTIEAYDFVGKQILHKKIISGTSQLDISNYNSGIYLLKVTNENNQSKTVKVVKQ